MRGHSEVYAPAEDTLLLADNLKVKRGSMVLEVGVGSGYLSLIASEEAGRVIGIDVNPHAVLLAKLNAKLNGVEKIEFILGSLHPIARQV